MTRSWKLRVPVMVLAAGIGLASVAGPLDAQPKNILAATKVEDVSGRTRQQTLSAERNAPHRYR